MSRFLIGNGIFILVNPLRTGFQCAVWAWQLKQIQTMNEIALNVLEHYVLLQLSLFVFILKRFVQFSNLIIGRQLMGLETFDLEVFSKTAAKLLFVVKYAT